MDRLTCILCCLFLVLSIALGSLYACAVEEQEQKQEQVIKPFVKLRLSNANDTDRSI